MNTSPFGAQVVRRTREVERIAALPRRVWTDDAAAKLAELLTQEFRRPGGTMKLRPVQAIALYEAMETGGLFGPIRVGHGKSLIGWLLPLALEAKRPVLLVPAALLTKTWDDYKALSEHWRLPTNVQLISYEMLGLVQSADKLEYIRPDLLVCDEAHMIKSPRAGRTRRVVRYMREHPETKFVGMSGTIMKSSLRDFSRFLRWGLKGQAPVPMTDDEVSDWADCLDEKTNPLARRRGDGIFELGPRPSGVDSITAARRVFQSRLLETRGVVASAKSDTVSCSLRVSALEYQLSPVTEEHFHKLKTLWETPCGRAFSEATELRMYTRELALGFSYTWIPREKVTEWANIVAKSGRQDIERLPSVGESPTQNGLERFKSSGKREIQGTQKKPGLVLERDITRNLLQRNKNENRTREADSTGKSITTIQHKRNGLGEASSNLNMGLPKSSSLPWLLRKEAPARFVQAMEGVKGSVSTTTIRQDESEDCFAMGAMSRLASSETMPLGLSEPLRIFLEQNRPPSEWLNARREWCSFVREQISRSQKYDTMLQVANACRAGLLDSATLEAWRAVEDSYQPLTRPIFYDVAALEACLGWMSESVGIVWVEHQAFGQALSRLSGAPYFGAKGLDGTGACIKDEKGGRVVIASVAACKQGFNLQMFSKNLMTSFPSGALVVEQTLGRTHRDGQQADEVTVDVLLGCLEHYDSFYRAVDEAKAARDVLGHDQKILLSDVVFPKSIGQRKGPLWV